MTPIRITVPITAKSSESSIPSRIMMFLTTMISAVPMTIPRTEPSPPRNEHPPKYRCCNGVKSNQLGVVLQVSDTDELRVTNVLLFNKK